MEDFPVEDFLVEDFLVDYSLKKRNVTDKVSVKVVNYLF